MCLCNNRVFKTTIAVEAHTLLFDLDSLHEGLQKSTCFTGTLLAGELPSPMRLCLAGKCNLAWRGHNLTLHFAAYSSEHLGALLATREAQ